jgi:hypothetical protein
VRGATGSIASVVLVQKSLASAQRQVATVPVAFTQQHSRSHHVSSHASLLTQTPGLLDDYCGSLAVQRKDDQVNTMFRVHFRGYDQYCGSCTPPYWHLSGVIKVHEQLENGCTVSVVLLDFRNKNLCYANYSHELFGRNIPGTFWEERSYHDRTDPSGLQTMPHALLRTQCGTVA